jgi:tyrosyl-tRNA synthetase
MMGQTPQQCFLMPMLVGTDGVQKMSKSLDNYVAVEERPEDMYGKIMSIGDNQIVNYFELLTDLPSAALADVESDIERDSVNPMEHKKRLAWDITNQFHDSASADAAQAHFERVVQGRNLPEEMPELSLADLRQRSDTPEGAIRADRLLVAAGLAASNAEARRLLSQGAVEFLPASGESSRVDGERALISPDADDVLRAGRRRFVRFTIP